MRRLAILLCVLAGGCRRDEDPPVTVALPSCGDPVHGHWDERLALAGAGGMDARVDALIRTPAGIVAAGSFTDVAGLAAAGVARWDGAAWAALGAGLPGEVYGLALDDDGTLWAAGDGARAELRGYAAWWDGERWTINVTADGAMTGVAAIDGGIAVGGGFGAVGGVPSPGLAIRRGGAWSAGGLDDGSSVGAIARTPGGFCVGGALAAGPALPRRIGVACRSKGSWVPLGPPVGLPHVIARGPDGRWWAGGELPADALGDGPSVGVAYLGRDDQWHVPEAGVTDDDPFFPDAYVDAIAFAGDAVVVGGHFAAAGADRRPARRLARWTAAGGWAPLAGDGVIDPIPFLHDGDVRALLVDGARLHIGGSFTGAADHLAVNVATVEPDGTITAWGGAAGTAVAAGPGITALAATADGTGVLAAGGVLAPGIARAAVARFDGAWRALASTTPTLASTTPTFIAAVAELDDGSPVISGEQVMRWDGQAWAPLALGPAAGSPLLTGDDGALYFAVHDADAPRSAIMRSRDGVTVSVGAVPGAVGSLFAYDGRLVAVTSGDDDVVHLVAREPDGSWTPLVDPAPPIFTATATPAFGIVALMADDRLAAWNGGAWRELGRGHATTTLAACDRGLYTAGGFDGLALGFVDETGWWPLAQESEGGTPRALAITGDGVYLGGFGFPGRPGLRLWRTPPPVSGR